MKIAFETEAAENLNSVRGIGSYTQNLKKELSKSKGQLEISFVRKGFDASSYDLVHYPYFDLFFHTLPLKSKAKRIVTIHDVIPLVFPDKFPAGIKGHVNLLLQKLALKNVDFVICDSQTSKGDVVKKLQVPPEKVKVVYLAAADAFRKITNNAQLQAVRQKYHLPDKFALYVGDVNWNKNLKGLLESVVISKVPLVMVGSALANKQLPQVKELDRLSQQLGIKELIIKTGFVPQKDLAAIYNLSEVVVMPSFYEGFGLPVLEGMASGIPVICSQNSSLTEIGGSVAIFCDPASPADIAAKIKSTISLTATQRFNLAAKCLAHAKKFSWEKTAQQTIDIYQEALK